MISIKRIIRYTTLIIIFLIIVYYSTIEVGGDGKSFSIKINNETTCAYSNEVDITKEFQSIESEAKQAIIEYYKGHNIEFFDLCHLGDTFNMTIDISVDDNEFFTITWCDGEISNICELDTEYVEQWYKFDSN